MSIDEIPAVDSDARKPHRVNFDRHSVEFREEFVELTDEFHAQCPVVWNDTYGGYWFVNGNKELFDVARRADVLSNDHDVTQTKRGYHGIQVPYPENPQMRGGFLEMDPPEQRYYRQALNPYLSPAAVERWKPFIEEITRACIDEVIETGSIDFVDDLANIVPAVFTMAMLGLPLTDWVVYCEPIHAVVYTPPDAPEFARVMDLSIAMFMRLLQGVVEARVAETPKPGLVDALVNADINGQRPDDMELAGVVNLLIGGGFDTTTALTAHALEWLSEHPDERERLSTERGHLLDSATEEFLRFYTPAQGDGRTVSQTVEINGTRYEEGDRLWLSWAMANRDATVFDDPHSIQLDRPGNRHSSFGLGIHRCIGSNVARATFKTMLTAVLDRMPDFVCTAGGGVHYDSTAVINGMKKLPATFTPGTRVGASFDETLVKLQRLCDEQGLAAPITVRSARATVD